MWLDDTARLLFHPRAVQTAERTSRVVTFRASFRTSFPVRSDEMGQSLTDGTSRVAKPVVSLPVSSSG